MPYRRLPNTDKARLRAMKTALNKQEDVIELVIAYKLRSKLQEVLQHFEDKLTLKNITKSKIIAINKEHNKIATKSRMYISHFIQVVGMSVQRGELAESTFDFYGINYKEKKLPDISNDKLLLKWGNKIISGETDRMNKCRNRIYNPSLALVNINFKKFEKSFHSIQIQQDIKENANKQLCDYRHKVDALIVDLWNKLEAHFHKKIGINARKKCEEWGIKYVYRKGELEKIRQKEYAESISMSLNF